MTITLSTRALVAVAHAEYRKTSIALEVAKDAYRAQQRDGMPWNAELYKTRRAAEDAYKKAYEALLNMQQQARTEFLQGRPKGWQFAPQREDGQTLYSERLLKQVARAGLEAMDYPVLDHTEVILCDGRPVAIVSHSYAKPEEIEQYAAAHHLNADFLWWSWYFPGRCTAVIFTKEEAL